MKAEEQARQHIDQLLKAAGWIILDSKEFNLGAALGVAIHEFSVTTGTADYALFIDRIALGVFCLEDESLEDSANLLDLDVLAAEIVEDLEAALRIPKRLLRSNILLPQMAIEKVEPLVCRLLVASGKPC